MAKFVNEEKKCVAEGEQVFINQTLDCISVMTGIAFNKDGDYSVSVREGRVIVTEEPVRHGKWTQVGKRAVVYRCSNCKHLNPYATKCCPECGTKMDGIEEE